MPRGFIRSCAGLFMLLHLNAADRFVIRYFYDHVDSSLELRDLVCPSIRTCVAAGALAKDRHLHGVAIVTADGGKHWSEVSVDHLPLSLFFLRDSLGWMVTDRGLLRTTDGGRSWNKVHAPEGLLRVWFLDDSRGFAVGYPKAVYETSDGGKSWSKVDAAATPPTSLTESVSYHHIQFTGDHGLIVGASTSPSSAMRVPFGESGRRTQKFTLLVLETIDRGKTWRDSKTDVYGFPQAARIYPTGGILMLLGFPKLRDFISEVCRLDWPSLNSTTLYREKNRAVTDVLPLSGGEVFLAAVEPPGAMPQVPVPGKLKILRSRSLETWIETDVDYRAIAKSAFLAASDAMHIWVATDTGMILELVAGSTSTAP